MKAWLQQLAELRNILAFLRPYLIKQPLLLAAVLASALFVMLFEGFGVGLLVPLLNLLLGGERATPMRPLQWLERTLPGHSPAFYIGSIAVTIVLSVALKNVAFYTSLVLAARLKRRIAVRLRDDLFRRLHRADLDLFDRLPGGDLANVFLVETYRTTVAIDAMLALIQRTSIAAFYVVALFFLSWPLTTLVVVLAAALGSALSFVYGRLKTTGVELTDLNHRMAGMLGQSFSGVRIVRATHSQDREIEQFHALNNAQAGAEERSAEALSLLFPITETLAVVGGMVIVTCAYIFLVRPGYMLSSYLLAYGFILLRLLPLLNQLYGLHGHLAYLAGGIHEVKTWLDTPHFPSARLARPRSPACRIRFVRARQLPIPERQGRARRDRFRRAGRADGRDRRLVGRGQVDAGEHPAAPSRADRGTCHRRRARLLGVHRRELASRDRARRAGRLSLSRHAAREHRVRLR